ncbi:orotidine-5'-phosphate decarboxylase, partial [Gammaproteobacteria bacterium]|nr:orotidine-5'-phosphate decarboxylase [Gammaproteobacteria bacterium]MDA9834585.1 orotidine-5'-phosphate decarboxylase [Gammaproteobacteria bacterium]MDA9979731.1 orotidine-5'-phosphate decarboxylase [Gammaproteobacteria bacterium]
MIDPRIIVAIDTYDYEDAVALLDQLNPELCRVKVGSVVFNALGKDFLRLVNQRGFKIFLDLKLHDIPNTVHETILGFADCNIELLTIHLSGGQKMITAAMAAAKIIKTKIIGVSILTSLNDDDTSALFQSTTREQVARLFKLVNETAIDGIVCSPLELDLAANILSAEILKITPGIRDIEVSDDQYRTMTANEAIKHGASYVVVGRPISKASNISEALKYFNQSINE